MESLGPTTAPRVRVAARAQVRRVVRGDTIGRYLVLEPIGQGGMGTVFAARDPRLGREVALKVIRADVTDASYRARVMREAQALARLSHPNVVPVFDVGVDEGLVWVAMQRLRGPTLAAWYAERPGWLAVTAALIQAGRGLAVAHAAGLVHRDFKPANVMFDADGRVLVLDFGLAWAPHGGADSTEPNPPRSDETVSESRALSCSPRDPLGFTLTVTGAVVGTPPYMAPEQHEGHQIDARSDQYAFCVTLYEGIFEHRPFAGDVAGLVAAKRAGPPARPRDAATREVPDRLWRAIERGLQPEPSDRWPSLDDLLDALIAARRPARRWPIVIAAAVAATLGVAASGHAEAPARCESLDALDASWNDVRRERLAAAFAGLGAAHEASWSRVQSHVDNAVSRWRTQADRACAPDSASGDSACVVRAAVALDEALAVLESAEPSRAARAVRVIEGLGSTHDCDHSDLARPRLDEPMRRMHERGRSLMAAGALEEAGEAAHEMLTEAHAATDPDAVAWALLLLGGSEMDRGERQTAEQHLRDALWTATAAGEDLAATTAAIKLVHLCTYQFDTECAQPWLRNAQAGLARLGASGQQVERELDLALGDVALRDASFTDALGHYQRALASARAATGDVAMFEASVLNSIGAALAMAGRHEEALVHFAEASEIEARELGRSDTARSYTLELTAGSLYALGRLPEARAAMTEGLANLDAAYGEGHRHAIRARGNLVLLMLDEGQLEPALALAERVVELKRAAFGPQDVQVAIGLHNEATVHTRMGTHAVALQRYTEALALWESARGPGHLDLTHPLAGQANAWTELGDPHQAVGAAERARALYEQHHVEVPGELMFDLGRAMWQRGRDRGALEVPEALAWVRRAREALPQHEGQPGEVKSGQVGRTEVDAWLAAHAP